jgi:hypothetical protein
LTTANWVTLACSLIGILGQWGIGRLNEARRRGETDQKLKQFGYDILHLQEDSKDHETRISTIEGQLKTQHGTR